MSHRPVSDYDITAAMQRFGGSFVRTLGTLAQSADLDNLARLKAAFPEYWTEYAELVTLKRKRDDAS